MTSVTWKRYGAVRGAMGASGRSGYARLGARFRNALATAALPRAFSPDRSCEWVRPAYRRRAMRRRRLLSWLIPPLVLLAAAVLVNVAALRVNGVVVLARQEMPSVPVFFYQEDAAWAADRLGASGRTLGKSGDGVACLASLIEMQQLQAPVQGELNPGTLNAWLSANGAYDGAGSLNWSKTAALLGAKLVEKGPGWNMGALLERLLQDEVYPIVKVRRPDTGAFHDVLVVGTVHGEFVIVDPLDPTGIPNSLSLYNNRIYSVRYLK